MRLRFNMKKYFNLVESPLYANKYIIEMNYDNFLFPNGTNGSYQVFVARLLNLSYADYLRYARDRLGAELIGKKSKYVTVYFDRTKEVEMFVKLLNTRMEFIMNEHQYPFEYKENNGEVERIPFKKDENNN